MGAHKNKAMNATLLPILYLAILIGAYHATCAAARLLCSALKLGKPTKHRAHTLAEPAAFTEYSDPV